jgi:hypothetical protein
LFGPTKNKEQRTESVLSQATRQSLKRIQICRLEPTHVEWESRINNYTFAIAKGVAPEVLPTILFESGPILDVSGAVLTVFNTSLDERATADIKITTNQRRYGGTETWVVNLAGNTSCSLLAISMPWFKA